MTTETKQDEIREGMWEFILEVRQYLCNTEFAPGPFSEPVDLNVLREMGNTRLKKMNSQGCVLKVEGKLPEFYSSEHRGRKYEALITQGMRVAFKNAGYGAYEEL